MNNRSMSCRSNSSPGTYRSPSHHVDGDRPPGGAMARTPENYDQENYGCFLCQGVSQFRLP